MSSRDYRLEEAALSSRVSTAAGAKGYNMRRIIIL